MSDPSDFRVITPIAVTDSILTSSTIPETTVSAYSAGTTYALGDIAGVAGANNSQVVYKSLQASNTGHTPASSPTWWQVLGTVYGTYSSGTTYAAGDVVTDTANHLLYESTTAGNLGNALGDTTKWTSLGATNRWKMFDQGVYTQSSQPESMTLTFTPGQVITTLMLFNCAGTSVTVTQSDSGYSETKSLVSHDVGNWFDWFYTALILESDAAFDDIPPYPSSVLTVAVTNPGGTVSTGACILGKGRTIGSTLWDFKGNILSYSVTTTDAFGNVTIVPRPNAKRLNFQVYIPVGLESETLRLCRSLIDTPIVVIGASGYSMSYVYCMLGQVDIPVSISGTTPANIEVKGLI